MEALLSLGGNVGDRKAANDAAVMQIAALPGTTVVARSSYYRTAPDGPVAQDWFLNTGLAVTTALSAADLATACRAIEAGLGRDRSREIPWGPRTIDIDVVAAGTGRTMASPKDTLDDRPFVLVPLAEIAPDTVIGGRTLADRRAAADTAGVEKLDWAAP